VIFRNLGQRGERDCCGLSQPAHDSVSRRRGVQGTALASGSVRKRESVTQGGDRGAPEGHFFFQAEDCIRYRNVTGVQTCALPILAGEELLDDFYQVFSRNMRDLGTPVYGKEFFKSILHTFPKEAKICTVSLEGKPLAVGFLYGFREMLEIPWACSDRRFARLAPNMLLYSSVLEYACRSGFRMFDFGRSTVASGTYRFKEQWGARPIPLFWYYWLDHSGPLPELNPQNPTYSLAISLWRRLPIPLTRIIGPH